MDVMSLEEIPWKYHHHRSSLLPPICVIEEHFALAVSSDVVTDPQSPILTCNVESKGNLCNITKTMPVEISVKPWISEKIYIGQNSSPEEVQSYTTLFKEFSDVFAWTYEEIPGIDPSIVVHEIKTYLGAKPVR